MTPRDDLADLRHLRDVVPPPDPHRRADARARLLAAIDARDPAHRPTITRGSGPPVWSPSTPAPAAATRTGRGPLRTALVLAAVVVVAVVLGWQLRLPISTPLPVVDRGENAVNLYGDGNISCPNHVADDTSRPVGRVEYFPGERELRVVITLTEAAPYRSYGVELWSDRNCHTAEHPWGPIGTYQRLTTDGTGAGELEHVFRGIPPGRHRVNVNLVDDLFDESLDHFRNREMGAATFTDVVVGEQGRR